MKKITMLCITIIALLPMVVFAGGKKEEPAVAPVAEEGPVMSENLPVQVTRPENLPDLNGRTIIAVTGNDYIPLNFVDPSTSKSVGFEYDLTNTIAFILNANIQWEVGSWDTMISAVKEGQYDVGMDGITITEEREKEIDFSDAYLLSQQVMLVRADETRFSDAEEFAKNSELLIGSQAGTTQFYTAVYEVLDGDENNKRIILLDNFSLVVQALLSGDVDLVLMDKVSADGYIGVNANKLKVVGDTLGEEDFGYIFTPDSDLREPFNLALQHLKDEGVTSKLETIWFYEYKNKQ